MTTETREALTPAGFARPIRRRLKATLAVLSGQDEADIEEALAELRM